MHSKKIPELQCVTLFQIFSDMFMPTIIWICLQLRKISEKDNLKDGKWYYCQGFPEKHILVRDLHKGHGYKKSRIGIIYFLQNKSDTDCMI